MVRVNNARQGYLCAFYDVCCYNAIFIYFCYRMSRRLEPTDVAAIEKVRLALSHSSSHSSNTL